MCCSKLDVVLCNYAQKMVIIMSQNRVRVEHKTKMATFHQYAERVMRKTSDSHGKSIDPNQET